MEQTGDNSEITAKPRGRPFPKGESGNLNGRPVGQKNYSTLYREALIRIAKENNTEPDEIEARLLRKGVANAIAGDYRFYKDVLDRIHGSVTNKTDITSGGEKILIMPQELINKHEITPSTESDRN